MRKPKVGRHENVGVGELESEDEYWRKVECNSPIGKEA